MKFSVDEGLLDPKHYEKMGAAVWLFLWYVKAQTKSNGLVFGGSIMSYKRISENMHGFPVRTIERWNATLVAEKYIQINYVAYKGMVIRVLNQKKFGTKQGSFSYPADLRDKKANQSRRSGGTYPAKLREVVRKSAGFNKDSKEEIKERGAETLPPTDKISIPTWLAFLEMRHNIRKPLGTGGSRLIGVKLLELAAQGEDVELCVQQSVRSSWADVYPLKKEKASDRKKLDANEITRRNLKAAGYHN